MEGLRERDGAGTGTPFRDEPPPPPLSRKGALRAGSSINAPLRDKPPPPPRLSRSGAFIELPALHAPFSRQHGGGGLSRKGVPVPAPATPPFETSQFKGIQWLFIIVCANTWFLSLLVGLGVLQIKLIYTYSR